MGKRGLRIEWCGGRVLFLRGSLHGEWGRVHTETTEVGEGEAIRIPRRLGARLFEAAYEEFMARSLANRGLSVKRQWVLPVTFDGHTIPIGYRVDLLVNDRIVVELKCSERAHDAHARQVLTYLRLAGYRTGLLINFGFDRLIDGVQRIVNGYEQTEC